MTPQIKKDEDKLVKIKFDGQAHQVDAQVFISTLVNFSEVVKEVNREVGSNKKIEIKIVATAEGSFDAHLVLQAIEQSQAVIVPVAGVSLQLLAVKKKKKNGHPGGNSKRQRCNKTTP